MVMVMATAEVVVSWLEDLAVEMDAVLGTAPEDLTKHVVAEGDGGKLEVQCQSVTARLLSRRKHHRFESMMTLSCRAVSVGAPSCVVTAVLGFDAMVAPVCLVALVIHYVLQKV